MTTKTHYDTLKVTQDAPAEVISAAYKALARIYHPDKAGAAASVAIMQDINISYKILMDPQKRAEHDAWLKQQERRAIVKEERRKNKSSFSGQDRRRRAARASEQEKIDKALAEATKWTAWADKTAQEAKEAQARADKAIADSVKAKPEDRAKWEAWIKKAAQEAKETKERADKAAAQSAKATADALEAASQVRK